MIVYFWFVICSIVSYTNVGQCATTHCRAGVQILFWGVNIIFKEDMVAGVYIMEGSQTEFYFSVGSLNWFTIFYRHHYTIYSHYYKAWSLVNF